MKLFLFFSIGILCFGCNKTDEKRFIVSGNVKDPETAVAKLKIADSVYLDTLEKGTFLFAVPCTNEQYANLDIGVKLTLYVKPGDSLHLNSVNSRKCNFSGKGFEESEFLYHKEKLIMELGFDDPRKIDIALFSKEALQFQAKIDSFKQVRFRQLEDFKRQYPNISDTLYAIEKQRIEYFGANQLFLFPEFHEMLTQRNPNLPDGYYDFTQHIEPDRKELYAFVEYKSAINSLLDLQTETLNDKYWLAKETLTDAGFFEEIMYKDMDRYINFNGIDNIDSVYVDFIGNLSSGERKINLISKYNTWKKLAKGEKAPDFEIKDEKGNLVRLSDFRGSYVYIDCWSSNCGPCIAEMPFMKKLADDFSNKNIVFVSISADEDTELWLNNTSVQKNF